MSFNQPLDVVQKWMELIQSRNLQGVLSLYSKDAIIIPTFSDSMQNSPQKIKAYFNRLFSRTNLSITLHDKTIKVQNLNNELSIISGMYCWKFDVEEELISYEARFSFIVDKSKESPIIHHHSSQIPRMI